jgi:hypothetical protein
MLFVVLLSCLLLPLPFILVEGFCLDKAATIYRGAPPRGRRRQSVTLFGPGLKSMSNGRSTSAVDTTLHLADLPACEGWSVRDSWTLIVLGDLVRSCPGADWSKMRTHWLFDSSLVFPSWFSPRAGFVPGSRMTSISKMT